MAKSKTVHHKMPKSLPSGFVRVPHTFKMKSPSKKWDAGTVTLDLIQIEESAEGINALIERGEMAYGDGYQYVARIINQTLSTRTKSATTSEESEAEARKFVERCLPRAATPPSRAKQQVRTFQQQQDAWIAEHGEDSVGSPEYNRMLSEYYASLNG